MNNIEKLQKVIELHEEIEKKNWDYANELCAKTELDDLIKYETEYTDEKGIDYQIIQAVVDVDGKNVYVMHVSSEGKTKCEGIELVRKLLEAEKERQAEREARKQEMKEETEKAESEKRQVKRVSVDNQEEMLKDLMLKVIDRTDKDYSYILHVIEKSFWEYDAGHKIVCLNFAKAGIRINADRKMAGFLMNYMSDRITYDMQKKKGEMNMKKEMKEIVKKIIEAGNTFDILTDDELDYITMNADLELFEDNWGDARIRVNDKLYVECYFERTYTEEEVFYTISRDNHLRVFKENENGDTEEAYIEDLKEALAC